MKKLLISLTLFALLLTGCGSKDEPRTADYDINGTWAFRMSELDKQDEVYATGIITFSGDPTEGEYIMTNSDGDEISGTYIVSRVVFGLDGGDDFRVKGSFPNANQLFGTWESGDSRAGGGGGLWTAEKQ